MKNIINIYRQTLDNSGVFTYAVALSLILLAIVGVNLVQHLDGPSNQTENSVRTLDAHGELRALALVSARAGMVVAAQNPQTGLENLLHEELHARVLDVSPGAADTLKAHIDSSNLSLDQKLLLEKILLHQFDKDGLPNVTVYFRKATRSQANADVPLTSQQKLPFGLTHRKKSIPGVHQIIAVASGKGGVGKSTIATNLAVGLAKQGLRVGLMDCDVYGPSAQLMLGLHSTLTVLNGQLMPLDRFGVKVVSFGFLTETKSPVIWRGPMVSKAIEQLCYDVSWGEIDVMVLDLPPGTGDVQLTLAERLQMSGAIVVTTPQDVALIDAHKAISMFEKLGVPILGLVENMSHHICASCGEKDDIFGNESFENFVRDRKLERLARLPLNRLIRIACDTGQPIVMSELEIADEYVSLSKKTAQILNLLKADSRRQL